PNRPPARTPATRWPYTYRPRRRPRIAAHPRLGAWLALTRCPGRVQAAPVRVDDHGVDVAALNGNGGRGPRAHPGAPAADRRGPGAQPPGEHSPAGPAGPDPHRYGYDAEFRHDRDSAGVMPGHAPDWAVPEGTVSKSLAPVMRLG
ncbi:MAG: hypothetical protein WBF34_00145, partial [Streptosporangiaceae bacterium]